MLYVNYKHLLEKGVTSFVAPCQVKIVWAHLCMYCKSNYVRKLSSAQIVRVNCPPPIM